MSEPLRGEGDSWSGRTTFILQIIYTPMKKSEIKETIKNIGINPTSIKFLDAGTSKKSYIIKKKKLSFKRFHALEFDKLVFKQTATFVVPVTQPYFSKSVV